jgi:hypothetical protein
MREDIIVRRKVVTAELIYRSGRRDYSVYRWKNRTYVVRHFPLW